MNQYKSSVALLTDLVEWKNLYHSKLILSFIQLHGIEWVESLSADWEQSPKKKKKKKLFLSWNCKSYLKKSILNVNTFYFTFFLSFLSSATAAATPAASGARRAWPPARPRSLTPPSRTRSSPVPRPSGSALPTRSARPPSTTTTGSAGPCSPASVARRGALTPSTSWSGKRRPRSWRRATATARRRTLIVRRWRGTWRGCVSVRKTSTARSRTRSRRTATRSRLGRLLLLWRKSFQSFCWFWVSWLRSWRPSLADPSTLSSNWEIRVNRHNLKKVFKNCFEVAMTKA